MAEFSKSKPLWDQKRPTPKIRGAWFLFKWGPFGFWWPITWQGYLLTLGEILCIGGGVGTGVALIERGFEWGKYIASGSVFVFLILFVFSIRKTRMA
ncbi:hypothetical protein [Asticcacaulis excentricus]|uniref:Uncharacterized protein n=1 Tax=Asticcacaulis excentricus TaxID=78587 RepID=A0A3G9G6K8_9CAUL|nr:hypothetical protein [Asticcacaulis excentricus]BBF80654.1 hypothetical protein EM6_1239 [Asticcacaulis excentricus]